MAQFSILFALLLYLFIIDKFFFIFVLSSMRANCSTHLYLWMVAGTVSGMVWPMLHPRGFPKILFRTDCVQRVSFLVKDNFVV